MLQGLSAHPHEAARGRVLAGHQPRQDEERRQGHEDHFGQDLQERLIKTKKKTRGHPLCAGYIDFCAASENIILSDN